MSGSEQPCSPELPRNWRVIRPESGTGPAGGEPAGDWRLTELYAHWILPEIRRRRNSRRTLLEDATALRYWRQATGDPILKQIVPADCRRLREYLERLPGRLEKKLSSETVRKHCRTIQQFLNLAGPVRGHQTDNLDLFGWVKVDGPDGQMIPERKPVPYLKAPAKRWRPVRNILRPEEKLALFKVLEQATRPLIGGIRPPAFWRAIFTWLDQTGMRIGTSLKITWEMLKGQILNTPAEIEKGKNDRQYYVTTIALQAAEEIRNGSPRIFPYPQSERQFHRYRAKLFRLAGIDRKGLGCHGFRAALATKLIARNPWAAQRQLGHRSISTTDQHYADVGALKDALED